MTKKLLPTINTLLILGTLLTKPTFAADPRKGFLDDCAKAKGRTANEMLSPKIKFGAGEDPVEYFETYFDILDCYCKSGGRWEAGGCWFYWKDIESFAVSIGLDLQTECKDFGCNEKTRDCTDKCWGKPLKEEQACRLDCTNNVQFPCQTEANIDCEKKLEKGVMEYAKSLDTGQPDVDDPSNDTTFRDGISDDDPGYFFCQPEEEAFLPSPENRLSISKVHAQIYSNYSIVTHIEGEVWIKTKNAPRWAPAFKGQRLMIGDSIKTGRKGRAEVTFANSAIFRMRPLSRMWIPDHKCKTKYVGYLDMKFGKVWNKIDRERNPDMFICTPTACTSIRGTIYHGYHNEETGVTQIYIKEGVVTVMDENEQGGVEVSQGEHITINKGEKPSEENIEVAFGIKDKWWKDSFNLYYFLTGVPSAVYIIAGVVVVVVVIKVVKTRKRKR